MPWGKRFSSLAKASPSLVLPVIILGGIYGGVFTPTQSAAVACFATLLLGFLLYKKFTLSKIANAVVEATRVSSMVYLLVIAASIMGMMFSFIRLPQNIAQWVLTFHLTPLTFLLVVELVLLIMGFVFSSLPMVIVVLPLFLPAAYKLGIDPIFFGVMITVNLMIGTITPPVGLCLYVACGIADVRLEQISRSIIPFLLIEVAVLLLITYIPDLILIIPHLFAPK